jgi:hypothetical protein
MLDQRNPGVVPGDPIHLKRALLDLVVCENTGLWSLPELDRCLNPGGDRPPEAHVEDLVADLYAAGLIHRCGEFVCATRAAHMAERIDG